MKDPSIWTNGVMAIIGRLASGLRGPVRVGLVVFAAGRIATCAHVVDQSTRDRLARKPLQRPPRAEHFTGRDEELAWLLEALQPGRAVTVWAAGGMGKTAMVAEALWQLAPGEEPPERFPDGIIFHDFYSQPGKAAALEHIVRSIHPETRNLSEEDARQKLAGRRALLVLDGAEEAEDLPAVLRLRDSNGVLIISRNRGDAPDDQWCLQLKPLSQNQAMALLNAWQTAGVGGAQGSAIVERVGRLPLAVRLAGRYLDQSRESPESYLRWLEESPIAALSGGEHGEEIVAVLLEKSLGQVGEVATRALGAAGQLALAGFGWQPLAAALEEGEQPVRQALDELFNYGLLGKESPDRYSISHALIHRYALRLSPGAETVGRLAGYFAGLAREESRKGPEGYRRLDLERPHFLSLLSNCLSVAAYEAAARLVSAVDDYLDYQGYWLDWARVLEMGVTAARHLKDRVAESVFTARIGLAHWSLGQLSVAIEYYQQALAISQEIGDRGNQGAWLGNLANAYAGLRQVEKAIEYYQQALDIAREIGDRRGEGSRLGNLGNAYRDLGQVEKAIDCYEQALAISQEMGDRRGQGNHLGNLGNAYRDMRLTEKAFEYYEQALAVSRAIGDRRGESNHLGNAGNACYSLGQAREAIEHYLQALAISREIGDRRGQETWLGNLGNAYFNLGQIDKAIEYHQQALVISREIGDRRAEADHLDRLGDSFKGPGQAEKASACYQQALAISRELGDRKGEGDRLFKLGTLYSNLGQVQPALDYLRQSLVIRREMGQRHDEGTNLLVLGSQFRRLGQMDKAVDCVQQALAILEELNSPMTDFARRTLATFQHEQ